MINFELTSVYGMEASIRGMRNPRNSWYKSDSGYFTTFCDIDRSSTGREYVVGENDINLMRSLSQAGDDHSKFLRMMTVTVDITAPLYWWKEFDTYKVGTVANSCSTMHTLTSKEFTIDDFSHEHLFFESNDFLGVFVGYINDLRKKYIETKDKEYWWQIIQLLPSSYNQKRTVMLNYQVLRHIYKSRKNHKLDEWVDFCKWIESLPYSKDLLIS